MGMKHSVYDTDTHFSINPVTRVLKNESMAKTGVIQFDHNSERFTFEIPRMIEGHDMSQCDIIQVHYNNIDSQTKEQSKGVYDVEDMQICPDDDSIVILSWLISGNATKYVGSLNFLIRFGCAGDEGHLSYVWNTAIYTGISVSSGINNGEAVVYEYADILEQWKHDFEELADSAGLSAYEIWIQEGHEGTKEDFLASLQGEQGEDGHTPVKGIDYFTGEDKAEFTKNVLAEAKVELTKNVLAKAKAYTDEEIAKFDFIKVVDSLPAEGLPNKIYFVPKTDTQTQDLFDEFVWVNKGTEDAPEYTWEWITTKQLEIDLTNYATTEFVIMTKESLIGEEENDTKDRLTIHGSRRYAESMLEKAYPVGSIYLSLNITDPSELFGFGKWEMISDRFLIGASSAYPLGDTGGTEQVTLTAKQVPKVEGRIALHNGNVATGVHQVEGCFTAGITNTKYINEGSGTTGAESIGQIRFSNGGEGQSHNNMPPYLAVCIWKRTA